MVKNHNGRINLFILNEFNGLKELNNIISGDSVIKTEHKTVFIVFSNKEVNYSGLKLNNVEIIHYPSNRKIEAEYIVIKFIYLVKKPCTIYISQSLSIKIIKEYLKSSRIKLKFSSNSIKVI